MEPSFIHLRLHSEFSIVDGIARIDAAVAAAAGDGQAALALTDSMNLFGAVRFYKAARAAGVKPILGCDAWVSNPADRDSPHRLLLLVASDSGYLNLCTLITRAWLNNAHRGRGELDPSWLTAGHTEGLIALSGAMAGEVGALLLAGQQEAAQLAAERLSAAFPGRFYIELQRAGFEQEAVYERGALALAMDLDLPVVATHPIQFIAPEDFRAHEARVCIAQGYTLADTRRPRAFKETQYFLTQAQMQERFADVPAALANSVHIAKRCNVALTLGQPRLPDYPTPEGVSLDAHCRDLSAQGLERRLRALYPDPAAREQARPKYEARLDHELLVIAGMGFSGYFLIVADFINWAKHNGVPVGPGRGSGAGSLVAYALGITDLDPLKYDLLFERFLNPERVSMPDFDIDFCQDNRDRVIDYVKQKYGAQAVSQIATFGTLGAKAVVRDAGRVLDLPYSKCDTLSKLIPHNPADPWSLDRALREEPAFAEAVAADEEYGELIELSKPLEGLTRNVGMHAGGVLIAPGKLTDFCPLYSAGSAGDAVISQFDKDDVEAVGLVKFDFLGLTTLTILALTLEFVKRLDPDFSLTLETLPLDDAATYDLFKRAHTAAIFQFESRGMRELLKRARPDRLEDLIALNALYRPGPMDLVPDFVERKHGRQRIDYLHPALESILGETYGIMVYQEQVMRIAQVIGGYSLGGADLLRRAMGKKKPEEMAKQRSIFLEGAKGQGVSETVATQLFDHMEKFAGYGFNKSHSAAYALLAYQTAYFKAHYPAAFMAANLTAVMDDTDKVKELIDDCRALGLTVEPPSVNEGVWRFEPVDARTLRYGLGGIKGTGRGAIEAIVAARAAGPFQNLFEFCERTDSQLVNRRVLEALVRAGAFDGLDADRAMLFANAGRALEHAQQRAAHAQQVGLFDSGHDTEPLAVEPLPAKAWSTRERLGHEKLALGYYLSGHLFAEYEAEARQLAPTRLADVKQARESVRLAGVIVSARTQNTRRGRMGVVVLDDQSAQLELMVFAELFDRKRSLLKEDTLVFVTGRVRFDEFNQRLSISADDVMDLAQARAQAQAQLRIEVDAGADLKQLKSALATHRIPEASAPAGCRVVIGYRNTQGLAKIVLPETWRVRLDDRLIHELPQSLQAAHVSVHYGPS